MIYHHLWLDLFVGCTVVGSSGAFFPKLWMSQVPDQRCKDIQRKIDLLKKKMDINIPIHAFTYRCHSFGALGSKWSGMGWIVVPWEEICDKAKSSDEVQTASLAHEIAHIKHNDVVFRGIREITAIALHTIFVWMFFPAAWISFGENLLVVSYLAMNFFYQSEERAADEEACRYLTNSEKLALSNWFDQQRLQNTKCRNSPYEFWIVKKVEECLADKDGELRFSTHPTYKSRIEFFRSQVKPSSWKIPFFRWAATG